MAISHLTLALSSEATMGMINSSMDADWPSRLAWKIVKALFAKFKPEDTMSRVELRSQLNQVGIKEQEDPDNLFEQLAKIENSYNTAAVKVASENLIAAASPIA